MRLPFHAAEPLDAARLAALRRRAIFDCCKWDPHVEDSESLAPFPLILDSSEWERLAGLAEQLAAESLAAEAAILRRPDLWPRLGLPRPVLRALARGRNDGWSPGAARVMRFDFHFTTEGWRISEVNSDVPGGFIEAAGIARLMAGEHPGTVPCGDPAAAYADAALAAVGPGALVALVHATAYTDDRQVMIFLGNAFEAAGLRVVLAAPDQVRWEGGRPFVAWSGSAQAADLIVRFFPGEWLPNLPRRSGWKHFFAGARVPLSNPATALVTQSKRFPLVWDELHTPLDAWRELLPPTFDPRNLKDRYNCSVPSVPSVANPTDDWVLKPALGRVGEDIGLTGVTGEKQWRLIRRDVARRPHEWAAQRRFEMLPLETDAGPAYACLGVYTIDGRAAGVYGRLAPRPLINYQAQDVVVLLAQGASAASSRLPHPREFSHEHG